VPVQLVYRRVLAEEIFDARRDVADLLSAYRAGKICMVNSMRSYVACDEGAASASLHAALRALFRPARADRLRASTRRVDPSMIDEILAIRRNTSSRKASRTVDRTSSSSAASPSAGRRRWRRCRGPWIVQDFVAIPRMDLPILSGSPDASGSDRASKYVNWNPFIFGGKVAGSNRSRLR